jgi:hypothetical protein
VRRRPGLVVAKYKSPFDLAIEGALIKFDLWSTLRSRETSFAPLRREAGEIMLFHRDH